MLHTAMPPAAAGAAAQRVNIYEAKGEDLGSRGDVRQKDTAAASQEDFKGFQKKMKLEFVSLVSYIGLEWFGMIWICSIV